MRPISRNNFLLIGTTQFLSVPYALFSKTSSNGLPAGTSNGDILYWNGVNWEPIPAGMPTQVLTLDFNGKPVWKNFAYSVNAVSIGDLFHGGIVAYILQPGDPGYHPYIQHGIIAAPFDQGMATWGCFGVSVP